MIKNIVFDLGGVLVDFNALQYLGNFGFDEATTNLLHKIIFGSKEWSEFDRGTYPHTSDLVKALSNKYPELSDKINLVLHDNWLDFFSLKADTSDFLKDLKQQNTQVYILSNISEDSYNYVSQYDFFNFVSGGVYSYDLKICKPDTRIYNALLEKYNLIPEETVFIDDNLSNVQSANNLGIHGVHFTTLNRVKEQVNSLMFHRGVDDMDR